MFNDVEQNFIQVMMDLGLNLQLLGQNRSLAAGGLGEDEIREQIIQQALEASDIASIGLEVGHRISLDRLGVFGYALMNSVNVDAALKLLLQYQRALMPHVSLSLLPAGEDFALVCHAKHLSAKHERFTVESLFVIVRNCVESLFPHASEQQLYRFDYPEPSYGNRYRELLGDQVSFAESQNAIIIPADMLQREIAQADPISEALYRQQCDELSKKLGRASQLSSRVQQILLRNRGQFLSAVEVATKLNMSESSLRRKLRLEGNSFQQLLDQIRLHLAQQYLKNTQLSIAEVGRLIGYDDVANFRKAFKRWSGELPSKWRDELM